MNRWKPFWYAGFYDVPRGIVVKDDLRYLILVSDFDEAQDEYGPYTVFEIEAGAMPTLETLRWDKIDFSRARLIGSIPAERSLFDSTCRRLIRWDIVLERLENTI